MKIPAGVPTFNGIPTHPLLVHFAVVLIPLACLLAVLIVAWPAARRRIGFLAPLAALVATAITPLTVDAGEALADTKKHLNPALVEHIRLGHQMLWWMVPLFVATTVFWGVHSLPRVPRAADGRLTTAGRAVAIIAAGASIVCAVGSLIWVYRIGDSGARSVWVY